MKQLLTILLLIPIICFGQNARIMPPTGSPTQVYPNLGGEQVNRYFRAPMAFFPYSNISNEGIIWYDSAGTKKMFFYNGTVNIEMGGGGLSPTDSIWVESQTGGGGATNAAIGDTFIARITADTSKNNTFNIASTSWTKQLIAQALNASQVGIIINDTFTRRIDPTGNLFDNFHLWTSSTINGKLFNEQTARDDSDQLRLYKAHFIDSFITQFQNNLEQNVLNSESTKPYSSAATVMLLENWAMWSQIDTAYWNHKQPQLNGTGFVKASGATVSYDNTVYYPASNPNGYTSNAGTVTTVTVNPLSPLFTASVSNPTTTPSITYSLTPQTSTNVLIGPTTGAAAAPTFRALVQGDIPTSLPNVTAVGTIAALNATAATIPSLNVTTVTGASGAFHGYVSNTVIATAGNYTITIPAGTTLIKVKGCAAGGGSAGSKTTGTAFGTSAGGGSGGYFEWDTTATAGTWSSLTCTVGAAGSAGCAVGVCSTSPTNGGNGGNTLVSYGTQTITAFGGGGAAFVSTASASLLIAGGSGGAVSTNGRVNQAGAAGGEASPGSATSGRSGVGAASAYGGGGRAIYVVNAAGNAGASSGSGGGGSTTLAGATNAMNGAAGKDGILIFEFYY